MRFQTMKAGDGELDLSSTTDRITRIEPLGLTSSFCAEIDPSLKYEDATQFDIDSSGTYQGNDDGCIESNNLYGFDERHKEWYTKFYIHATVGSPVRLTIETTQ